MSRGKNSRTPKVKVIAGRAIAICVNRFCSATLLFALTFFISACDGAAVSNANLTDTDHSETPSVAEESSQNHSGETSPPSIEPESDNGPASSPPDTPSDPTTSVTNVVSVVSADYDSNPDFYDNQLAITESGEIISAWAVNTSDRTSIAAAVKSGDTWSEPVTLGADTNSGSMSLAAAEDIAAVAWQQKSWAEDYWGHSELRVRLYVNGSWLDSQAIGKPYTHAPGQYARYPQLTALPGNRLGLAWSASSNDEAPAQWYSEWEAGIWSEPQELGYGSRYVITNQWLVDNSGNLSYFYDAPLPETPDGSTVRWVRDRVDGVWQTNTLLESPTPPAWLEQITSANLVVASSASGRQIAAQQITLTDSFGTRFYGISYQHRGGIGELWSSPQLEIIGNDRISNVQIAINDGGQAVVIWMHDRGTNIDFGPDETLAVARLSTSAGWIDYELNVIQSTYFSSLPENPIASGVAHQTYHLDRDGETIVLNIIASVFQEENPRLYKQFLRAEIGFDDTLIQDARLGDTMLGGGNLTCSFVEQHSACGWVRTLTKGNGLSFRIVEQISVGEPG